MHSNFATLFSAVVVFVLSAPASGQDAAAGNGNNLNSRVTRATMPNTARTSADSATPTVAPESASPAAAAPESAVEPAPASACADGSCTSRIRSRRVVTRSVVAANGCPCDETRERTVTRYRRRVFPLFARRGCCN